MTIGIIGVGTMGQHFATRILAAGHKLVAFDTNDASLKLIEERGAKPVASVREMATQATDLYLCLPTPTAVKAVVTELLSDSACSSKDESVSSLTVKRVVDLSTTGPSVTQEVDDLLSQATIQFVSAPVSGGPGGAKTGTLAMMAAGHAKAYQQVEPILNILAKNIFFLGEDPTLGQTMKIINNTLYATSMLASCEALVYGVKAGLDPQAMLDVLNVSSGRSYATMERIPPCVLDRSFPVRFTTALLHKDIKMCLDEAEKLGSPMFINQAARQFLAFAMTQGDGAQDNLFAIRHFEQWAGVQVGKEEPKC